MFDGLSCDSPPCPLQQHANFAAALRECGHAPLMLDGLPPILVLRRQFRAGIKVAMVTRAELPAPNDLKKQLATAGLHRHLLILSPDRPTPELRELGAMPVMTPATIAEIDLRPPHEERRAALHQKWRNRLVHADRQGLRITRQNLPLKPGHWLLRTEAKQQARHGYQNWPEALTLAYARQTPGAAKLFTAYEGRDPVAAMLFLRHGRTATYHIGHTTARGRTLSAHNLVMWQAMNWLASQGQQRLDLGMIDTQGSAAGIARFKLGTGARARTLGGTWAWWPPLGRALRPLARFDHRAMQTLG